MTMPGDLDKMRFAFLETAMIDTSGLTRASGLSRGRAKAALDELVRRGEATSAEGHHHGDGDFCQCGTTDALKMTHWYLRADGEHRA
jgi:hypothetical protein